MKKNIYENTLFASCIINGFYFWSLGFPLTGKNLAINKVTWFVNESCLICLVSTYSNRLLYQGPPVLFILVHWKVRVTNQNEIQRYRLCKIIHKSSINTIKKTQAININQGVSYLSTLVKKKNQNHGIFYLIHWITRGRFNMLRNIILVFKIGNNCREESSP